LAGIPLDAEEAAPPGYQWNPFFKGRPLFDFSKSPGLCREQTKRIFDGHALSRPQEVPFEILQNEGRIILAYRLPLRLAVGGLQISLRIDALKPGHCCDRRRFRFIML
jgi:hypothetical protein